MTRTPPCPHFRHCGGCSLQELSYDEQLAQKAQELGRIFNQQVPVHAAPDEFGYRGRMDFVYTEDGFSLRAKGRALLPVPIRQCLLLSEHAAAIFAEVQERLAKAAFPAYDLRSHQGFLRYVSLRETASGELMLIFTTATPSEEQRESFLLFLSSLPVASVYWFISDKKSDDAVCGKITAVIGQEALTERIGGIDYRIGPQTFFQSNREVAEQMFSRIKDEVAGRVLDVFCGVGAISLFVADKASGVVGVELVEESIRAARENAHLNAIENAAFLAEPVGEYVRHAVLAKESFDTIVLDPPRIGAGGDVMRGLCMLGAEKIVYMSCNPRSLRADLAALRGYRLVSLEGFDMFPQTDHVECLAILVKET